MRETYYFKDNWNNEIIFNEKDIYKRAKDYAKIKYIEALERAQEELDRDIRLLEHPEQRIDVVASKEVKIEYLKIDIKYDKEKIKDLTNNKKKYKEEYYNNLLSRFVKVIITLDKNDKIRKIEEVPFIEK